MRKSGKDSKCELRIFLTGFMGAGKSTVGNLLAKKLKVPFIDLDEVVEIREMRHVRDIFASDGEKYFREQESLALMAVIASLDKFVMATGGGIVLKKQNRDLMRDSGKIICLKVDVKDVLERLGNDKERPLLQGKDKERKIRLLMKKRDSFYKDRSLTIQTSGLKPVNVVAKILKAIKEK